MQTYTSVGAASIVTTKSKMQEPSFVKVSVGEYECHCEIGLEEVAKIVLGAFIEPYTVHRNIEDSSFICFGFDDLMEFENLLNFLSSAHSKEEILDEESHKFRLRYAIFTDPEDDNLVVHCSIHIQEQEAHNMLCALQDFKEEVDEQLSKENSIHTEAYVETHVHGIEKIRVGSCVRLQFNSLTESLTESLWVEVKTIRGFELQGELRDSGSIIPFLKKGKLVDFTPLQIREVAEDAMPKMIKSRSALN